MSIKTTINARSKSLLFGFAITGLAVSISAQEMPTNVQMPTGPTGGGYYFVGGIMGNLLESEIDGLSISAMPSQGSGENLNLIQSGEVQMAMLAANAMYPAWAGIGDFEGRSMQDYRLVMHLYPNPTVFVSLASSGITHLNQLEGRRVAAGSAPIPWDDITGPFIEAHGIAYPDDITVVYGGHGDNFSGVGDGRIAATIGTANMAGVQQLANQRDINFLIWDESARDELVAAAPFRNKVEVPAEELPGLDSGFYSTVDMGGPYLVVHKDVPDEFVYEVARVLNENVEQLAAQRGEFNFILNNPDMRSLPLGEVEFHPGAIRYWEEVDLWNQ